MNNIPLDAIKYKPKDIATLNKLNIIEDFYIWKKLLLLKYKTKLLKKDKKN